MWKDCSTHRHRYHHCFSGGSQALLLYGQSIAVDGGSTLVMGIQAHDMMSIMASTLVVLNEF
ncbi:unnamed protein product [Caenorhabditis brenneri]